MACRRSYEDIWECIAEEELEKRKIETQKRRNWESDYLWITGCVDVIEQDMEIMKELLKWKGYSLSDFFDEKGHVRRSFINGWIMDLKDWALRKKGMSEEDAKELGKLLRFCILYVCMVYKAELADLFHVKKLLSAQEMSEDFFSDLLLILCDMPDKQILINIYKRDLEGKEILERTFVHWVNRILSEYIEEKPVDNKVKSVHNWARKMVEDCALLTESGDEMFFV